MALDELRAPVARVQASQSEPDSVEVKTARAAGRDAVSE